MKKILIVLLVMSLLFVAVSCNSKAIVENTPTDQKTEEAKVKEEPEGEEIEEEKEESEEENPQMKRTDIVFQLEHPYVEQYEIWDITTEVFSDEILKELGADGFTGSDAEITQQIYDWQANNMEYAASTENYTDAGFGSRWNFMLPGIYPASKRLNHKNAEGKIYGICSDFSYIYVAIANAYDLDARVVTFPLKRHVELFGSLPEDVQEETTFRGLGHEEYDLLNIVLQENNIELTYDQIHRAIQGISTIEGHVQGMHSRAEVKIDGEWVAYDGTRAFGNFSINDEYNNADNYMVQNWDGIYNPIRLYAPEFQDSAIPNAPVDYDGLTLYFTFGPQVVYTGITDDFGNENRARDFDGLVNGDALLPYVADPQGLINFLHLKQSDVEDEGYKEIMSKFYEGTGRPLNIIADFLIYGDDVMDAEVYVRQYNGITGDTLTVEEFDEYLK